mmetsp:Transcript_61233/g.144513  ORF Transcript_61233/g.144513 Transcript_61233/m.144513 type:complete len:272 (-) Transcript_61233:83-898(-)
MRVLGGVKLVELADEGKDHVREQRVALLVAAHEAHVEARLEHAGLDGVGEREALAGPGAPQALELLEDRGVQHRPHQRAVLRRERRQLREPQVLEVLCVLDVLRRRQQLGSEPGVKGRRDRRQHKVPELLASLVVLARGGELELDVDEADDAVEEALHDLHLAAAHRLPVPDLPLDDPAHARGARAAARVQPQLLAQRHQLERVLGQLRQHHAHARRHAAPHVGGARREVSQLLSLHQRLPLALDRGREQLVELAEAPEDALQVPEIRAAN